MSGPTRLPRPRRALAGALLLAAFAATAAAAAAPRAVAAPHAAATQPPRPGPTGPAAKPGQIIWSAAPASAQGLDHRSKYVYNDIAPGSVIHDYVAVVNRSLLSESFSIYATDATGTTPQNVLTWLKVGDKPKDIGRWETFKLGRQVTPNLSVIIGGRKGILVPFTIKVPAFATPGDHAGAVMAQVGIPKKSSQSTSVIIYNRIAVPIELRVKGPYHSGLAVQSVSTSFGNPLNPFGAGSASVSYTVTNTGNLRLTGTDLVKVTGPFGMKAQATAPRLPVILPGDSVRLTATASGLYPAGPFSAHVSVTPGWARDEQPVDGLPLAESDASASLFAVPWSLLGVILLLVAIGAGAWYLLRWRRRQQVAEVTEAVARARREAEARAARRQPVGVAATAADGNASAPASTDLAQAPASGGSPGAGSAGTGSSAAEATVAGTGPAGADSSGASGSGAASGGGDAASPGAGNPARGSGDGSGSGSTAE
jgi:hypothetical protein